MTRRRCQFYNATILCGNTPSAQDLKEVEKFKARLAGVPQDPKEAREYAGLTLGQAAPLLMLERAHLEGVEECAQVLDTVTAVCMEKLYRCKIKRTKEE